MNEFINKLNIKKEIEKDKINLIVRILLAIVFATTIMFDSMIHFDGNIANKLSDTYIKSIELSNIITFFVTMIITYLVLCVIEIISDKIANKEKEVKERKSGLKVSIITAIVIIILWLPYILSFFPGGVFADSIPSISEALGYAPLHNRNPILHTLILKLFFDIARLFSNNVIPLGISLYTIAQVVSMVGIGTYFVYWLYKKNVSFKYIIFSVLFFGVFHLIPLYAISLWKDTVFCMAMFLYILFIADTIYYDGRNLETVRGIIKGVILSLLVMFLRNNGIYIVTLVTLILLIMYRKRIFNVIKPFGITIIITIAITYIIQGPVYNKLNMNTQFVESVGILVQQICYIVSTDGNINEEQKEFINEMCPIDVIKQEYRPCLVDFIKWNEGFNNDFISENKGQFLKVWFQLCIQNPGKSVKAYLLNTMGFWDVNKANRGGYINPRMWPTIENDSNYKQNDYIQMLTGKSIRDKLDSKSPISSAVFFFIILTCAQLTIYKKRYKNLLILVPFFATWITIMIAVPIAFTLRYVYILVLGLPIAIITPFIKQKADKEI
ncbi:MAG: hypothetical protein HFJ55_03155 [Clostridia bacterium]|nr:hypothetical protein [Clostridia bacterium]